MFLGFGDFVCLFYVKEHGVYLNSVSPFYILSGYFYDVYNLSSILACEKY